MHLPDRQVISNDGDLVVSLKNLKKLCTCYDVSLTVCRYNLEFY